MQSYHSSKVLPYLFPLLVPIHPVLPIKATWLDRESGTFIVTPFKTK